MMSLSRVVDVVHSRDSLQDILKIKRKDKQEGSLHVCTHCA